MAVKVYSTASCSYCTVIKKYLRDRSVKFTEYKVDRDERKYQEMVHKSKQNGVPVTDFNGKIIVGFDQGKLDRLVMEEKKAKK